MKTEFVRAGRLEVRPVTSSAELSQSQLRVPNGEERTTAQRETTDRFFEVKSATLSASGWTVEV